MVAERVDGLPGARVDLAKEIVGDINNAAIGAVAILPVHEPAMGEAKNLAVVVNPYFLAGDGIESNNAVVLSYDVHHVVDHNGIGSVTESVVARRVKPHLLQLSHVRAVDLFQGRVLGVIRRAAVLPPR